MSKVEALREAQLWLFHEMPKNPDLVRGLEFAADEQKPDADVKTLRPYYRAAFVLSGDRR
jgi:CHAT domain-containing protein